MNHKNNFRHFSAISGLLLVLILLMSYSFLFAQANNLKIPETPAGKRIAPLLKTINSGDTEKMRDYITSTFNEEFLNAFSLEDHLTIFKELYDESGGYEIYKIEESTDYRISMIFKNKLTELWTNCVLAVDSEPPHLLAGLLFRPADAPKENTSADNLNDREIVKKLEAYLEELVKEDAFSGTVLFAKNGKALFKKAYGLASKRFNVPNKIDTKFNLGSMNKMVTAVAIAQLVEKGKLSYNDFIGKYLGRDWIREETGKKVQIKHLLTHTSGLGSYFNKTYMEASKLRFRSVDDYKVLIADETLSFEPGSRWSYSNTGMFLLGAIIEKVTGETYFDYIRENIFEPAGMINTDSYEMDQPVPNLAIGYHKEVSGENSVWKNNLYLHVVKGGPAGGGFSTVEDLLKFDIALRTNKIISKESFELLTTSKPGLNSPDYGYGFGVDKIKGERIVGHGGGFPGISAKLDMYLDSGYTVAVLSNYSRGMQPVVRKLMELMGLR